MRTIKLPHCVINVDSISTISVCREQKYGHARTYEILFICSNGQKCETDFEIESITEADNILDALNEYLISSSDQSSISITSLIKSDLSRG